MAAGGGHNAGSAAGCFPWHATLSRDGTPASAHVLFPGLRADLEAAHRYRVTTWDATLGSIFRVQFGAVEAEYSVTRGLAEQGSGCYFAVRYFTGNRRIEWFHTTYARHRGHKLRNLSIVFPP